MKQQSKLSNGWSITTIGDLIMHDGIFIDGDWIESKDQDPNGNIRLIQLADIGDGYYRNKSNRFLTTERAHELNCTFLKAGDLLIARMPDPLGRACIFPGDIKESVTAVDVCIVRTGSKGANHSWLMYAINSPQFRTMVERLQSGSTRKRISRSNLAKITFSLPPLPEQERIVERIESLFTQLDAGVAGLKRVKKALKRYKASVLKAACEGRLVAQDPSDEPAVELLMKLGQEPLERDDLPELPEGWCWAFIGTVARKIQYGTSDKADNNSDGILVLRMGNLIDGQLDFKHLKFIQINSPGLSKLMLEPGDLLFNRTNSAELVGKTAVYKENHPKASFASYLIRVQMQPEILPDYISYYINSIYGRQYIMSVVSQQVGQANVNGTKLSKMPVPLPPSMEQYRIVAEVERRFSVVQELEQTIDANLKRAARLRQAILKRAFEGKLVGQDESVELLPPRKISTKEPVKKQDLEDPPEIESARQLELFD